MTSRRSLFAAAMAALSILPARAARVAASPEATLVPPIRLPRDFGAHRDSRIEWWYVTGALDAKARSFGFQITFFRASTGVAATASASRFAASELVFAHAAVSDVAARRLQHDQRIARAGFGIADAAEGTTDVVVRDWRLVRSDAAASASSRSATSLPPSRYRAQASSDPGGFAFDLALTATQPVLLQGEGGLSRKGPNDRQSSRYYSEPQLDVRGTLGIDGLRLDVTGRAWLDHEWSDSFLDPNAVGWDWIGMNLDDGGALTAFRIRRADGSTLWGGGSYRSAGATTAHAFDNGSVAFISVRSWRSAASNATYPVEWQVTTPVGHFTVRAAFENQELDSRASTGAIYWEGLSELVNPDGRRVGRGYLEMTGYAAPLEMR